MMQAAKQFTLMMPLIALMACGTGRSSDVKQSTIEQSYDLTYSESTGELRSSADFHYENTLGTSLKLTGNSNVTFNGTPMQYDNVFNVASYRLNTQFVQFPAGPQQFRYVNNDGIVFVTDSHVPAYTTVRLPRDGELIPGDRELQVSMQGNALVGGDEITLCLIYEPQAGGEGSIRECLHSEGPLSLVFSREQLARFPMGRALSLEVKREAHPSQNNPRIHLTETFLGRPIRITLQ